MKQITSQQNPLFKELKQLAQSSSARRKSGKTILDGIHLAQMYLKSDTRPLLCAFTATAQTHEEAKEVIEACWNNGVECIELSEANYRVLSPVEHGVGLLFVIKTPQKAWNETLTTSALLIDGIQDPGNLGTILRTAVATGVDRIFCSPHTVAAWSPKVMRAGMGAHFSLNIYENIELERVIDTAKVSIVATSSHAAETLYEADLNRMVAWLVGNEGQGVAEPLMKKATLQVSIPQSMDIESLNVSVATAVCLYEQLRQCRFG